MMESTPKTNAPAGFYIGPIGRGAGAYLEEFIAELQADDPLAPVTVVGPSTYANLSLRHSLGRKGFANVRFMVLPRVAELLGAPELAAKGRRPLTPVLESAAVRVASRNATGILHELRGHPSTHHSLRSTFRQLGHATEDALNRLEQVGELRREVLRLYRSFQDTTNTYYQREDLVRAAAEAVRKGVVPGLADLGFIVLYLIRDLSPGERDLAEALASLGQCAVFLGAAGEVDVDAQLDAMSQRLSRVMGEPNHWVSSDPPSEIRLLIAPDPHQEIRWVIRSLLKEAEAGVPLHRMAVFYRQIDPYGTLIPEELRLADLAAAGPNPVSLAETAIGRTLTGLVQLSDGELTRERVTDWLTGCPIGSEIHRLGEFGPSWWDAISRKAGIVRGLDQWTERLESYAADMERLASRAEAQGEVYEARAVQMLAEAEAARSLRGFVLDLAQRVTPATSDITWQELSGWARRLLDYYLIQETCLPDSEQTALEQIRGHLEELGTLDALEPGPNVPVFLQALEELLQTSLGHVGMTGQGVFVAPLGVAAAMDFDVVYIVGMIEGALPGKILDDPLLPDRDRLEAGGPAAGLPLQQSRRSEERYDFLSALASGTKQVLSFPRSSPASQRANYPSRWFLEQASRMEGSPVFTSTLATLGERPWLTVIPSAEQALVTVETETAADSYDYDLERLWRWRNAGLPVRIHPLAATGALARSLALGRGRNSTTLGEWDGDVSRIAGETRVGARLRRPVLSPTSLERWARCPFSYFLGNVLGISALDRPEQTYTINALERGNLIHQILEQFIAAGLTDGDLPAPGDPWGPGHRQKLISVAQDAFQESESRGVTGRSLLWTLEQADILSDLETFLEEDSQLRGRFLMSPHLVEAGFGLGESPWAAAEFEIEQGESLRFRGLIDRVDMDYSGGTALVIDYKTGGASSYQALSKDPVDRGKRLQLPVYALAAQQALGPDVKVQAAYWFVTARGRFALLPPEPVSLEKVRGRFEYSVGRIVSGITDGLFPANPGRRDRDGFENCNYCDFKALCPSRRDVLWNRKKRDSRLSEYVEMAEGEQP